MAVRLRPPLDTEFGKPENEPIVTAVSNESEQKIVVSAEFESKEFFFDQVFPQESTQSLVYESIGAPLVDNVFRGYNSSLLAYGQTGTGKTYTMGILGRVSRRETGIVPRALQSIFERLQKGNFQWSVKIHFVQIYMENVRLSLLH